MEVFEQVIQTSKRAFNASSHSHFILPAFSYSLEGDGIDVIWDEAAVRARSMTKTLTDHTTKHGLQSLSIAVSVLPHTLN